MRPKKNGVGVRTEKRRKQEVRTIGTGGGHTHTVNQKKAFPGENFATKPTKALVQECYSTVKKNWIKKDLGDEATLAVQMRSHNGDTGAENG